MCLDCRLDKGRSGKAFILGHSLETLGKPFQSLKQSQGIQAVCKSLGMRRLFAYHTGKMYPSIIRTIGFRCTCLD